GETWWRVLREKNIMVGVLFWRSGSRFGQRADAPGAQTDRLGRLWPVLSCIAARAHRAGCLDGALVFSRVSGLRCVPPTACSPAVFLGSDSGERGSTHSRSASPICRSAASWLRHGDGGAFVRLSDADLSSASPVSRS